MMTKEEYEEWANHPLTKKFHKFLMDYRESIMNKWAFGMVRQERFLEFQVRAAQAYEFAHLENDAIAEFYKEYKEDGNEQED